MAAHRSKPRICLTVDLDPLSAYHQIHGLPQPPRELAGRVIHRGWLRFLKLAEKLNVPATFFVVGNCLKGEIAELAASATRQGHELANHTQNHLYDFLSLNEERMSQEIQECEETVKKSAGVSPTGFRAPGYGSNPRLLKLLAARDYVYDSSLLPSPPYYLAKGAVMAYMKFLGKRSGARLHDPRTVMGPGKPYPVEPEHPFQRARTRPGELVFESSLKEIPISVTPFVKIPIIGTTVALAKPLFLWLLSRSAALLNQVVFECHAIDLLDGLEDNLPKELIEKQPDLKIPSSIKEKRIINFLSTLAETHDFCTMRELCFHEVQ